MRDSNRSNEEARKIEIVPNYLCYAEGSCLISFGNTKVLCAATIEDKVPSFLKGSGQGWITAEYSLLPRSTQIRTDRESVKGKQSGRTQEIQRLIGRALRASVNLNELGEKQIKIDCDVIQADGGTRTASICGSCVALNFAIKKLGLTSKIIKGLVGAISCGVVNDEILVDLDYKEDSSAEVDANFVFLDTGEIIEVQATGEHGVMTDEQLFRMLSLARNRLQDIFKLQRNIIS